MATETQPLVEQVSTEKWYLLSTEEGRESADAIVEGMAEAEPLRPQPEIPPFEPTNFGADFKTSFSTQQGTEELIAAMSDPEQRQGYVDFFDNSTSEARSALREIISTEEGRERMAAVMTSEGGQVFLEMLGERNLGQEIGGDDLWLSSDGRELISIMMESQEGKQAVLKLVTGLGVMSDAIASAWEGVPDYEDPAPGTLEE